jgi:hypothetical protein
MMPNHNQRPLCTRCRATITHFVIEKDAGEFIVRCAECNAANVLKIILKNYMAILTPELIGWRE